VAKLLDQTSAAGCASMVRARRPGSGMAPHAQDWLALSLSLSLIVPAVARLAGCLRPEAPWHMRTAALCAREREEPPCHLGGRAEAAAAPCRLSKLVDDAAVAFGHPGATTASSSSYRRARRSRSRCRRARPRSSSPTSRTRRRRRGREARMQRGQAARATWRTRRGVECRVRPMWPLGSGTWKKATVCCRCHGGGRGQGLGRGYNETRHLGSTQVTGPPPRKLLSPS
jgi:hypothetical protein